MYFKDFFISIADIIDAKFQLFNKSKQNPADKGELCELFLKEFLVDSLGDSFKIFRGGAIIDFMGNKSKQLDIVLSGKRVMKLFGDKGIYPTETIYGVVSVTATLSTKKMISCLEEFDSIPKDNFELNGHSCFPEEFIKESAEIWRTQLPFKCIFAFQGEIKEEWIDVINKYNYLNSIKYNSVPDLIIVNKMGMIEKKLVPTEGNPLNYELGYTSFKKYSNYGLPYAKLLYHLNNRSWEELFLIPKFEKYFNADL